MPEIRSFTEADVPKVAKLFETLIVGEPLHDSAFDHYRTVFFDNPWRDEELPSLVCEADGGEVVAFLGVVPRPVRFRGEALRAAVTTQFMVAEEWRRRLLGVQLLKKFFAGPQDLSFADNSGDASRQVWVGCGGFTSLLQSLSWTKVLRPFEHSRARLKSRSGLGPLPSLLRPLTLLGDVTASRTRYFRQSGAELRGEEVGPAAIAELLSTTTRSESLVPVHDLSAMTWLLGLVHAEERLGKLHMIVARDRRGEVAGFYSYYLSPGGEAEVAQLECTAVAMDAVLDHLFHDAASRGAHAVRGRFEPRLRGSLSRSHALFRWDGGWMIAHTRDPEVASAFHSGEAAITRLDGEWWIDFGRFLKSAVGS